MKRLSAHAGHQRYIALALITLILTVATANRATLSVAAPSVSRDLHLSTVQLGWLFSCFAWTYALGQIPAGWICDRIGTKKTMLGGLLAWSLTTMAMALVGFISWPFLALAILRLLLGVFETPVGPASGRVIATWFPAAERGFAGSVFNSAQYLALIIFSPLMGLLAGLFSWREVFWVLGAIALLCSLLWQLYFYPPRNDSRLGQIESEYLEAGGALIELDSKKTKDRSPSVGSGLKDIASLFGNRMLLGIFLGQYCINAITWFFVSWFPSYLVNGLGLSIVSAGLMAVLPAVLGLIGSLCSGLFSDYLLTKNVSLTLARKIPLTAGLLISFSMLVCIHLHSNFLIVLALGISLFGKGVSSGMVWPIIADVAPASMPGLTGGVSNAFANFAGVVTPVIIGYILARTGSFNGVLIYVCAHSLAALGCYWLVVGRLKRVEFPKRIPHG